jgi:hypothetical protein
MTRASDAARDAAAERLKDAYVRGALTLEELHHRVSTALTAPTVADLSGLTSDVPSDTLALPPVPMAQAMASGHPARSQRKRVWLAALIIGAVAGGAATAVVTHDQNKVPSHCLVRGHHEYHRVC